MQDTSVTALANHSAGLCDTCSSDTGPATTSEAAKLAAKLERSATRAAEMGVGSRSTTLSSAASTGAPQTASRLTRANRSSQQACTGGRQNPLLLKLAIMTLISVALRSSLPPALGQQQLQSASQPDGSKHPGAEPRPSGPGLGEPAGRQERLLLFWSLFRAAYPSLAFRLLSAGADEPGWPGSLDELARQLLAKSARSPQRARNQPLTSQHGRQSAWLARVSNNPAYAKLIQHLQRQKLIQHKQRTQADSPGVQPLPVNSSSLASGQRRTDNQLNYGRVSYYPHELTNTRQRTIDKLHQLQQITHKGSPAVDLPEVDGAAASEIARNKYVFGKILYTPDRSKGRQIALNQLATMTGQQQSARVHHQDQLGPVQESSYGRVLVSPQNPSPDMQDQASSQETSPNRWTQARLRQRLEPLESRTLDLGAGGGGGGGGATDFEDQLQTGLLAAESADQSIGQDFEGFWHSGPLAQVEVHEISDGSKRASNPWPDGDLQSTELPIFKNSDNAFLVD